MSYTIIILMLDTVFIITIILEIVITSFLVIKLLHYEKEVKKLEIKMVSAYQVFIEANKRFREHIIKLNKFIAFFTNRKFVVLKNIINYSITFLQFYFLFRSLNLNKGIKKAFTLKNLRKILIAKFISNTLKNAINKC